MRLPGSTRSSRDGRLAVDFNFWGVTFAPDATRFFATLGSGGRVFLVAGEPASHALTVVAEGIECPSLSPDGTRIAFKHTRDGSTPRHWQPAILELSTNRMTVLPETRSVDDQLEWLDNDTSCTPFAGLNASSPDARISGSSPPTATAGRRSSSPTPSRPPS